MTAVDRAPGAEAARVRSATLVWIDATEAVIVRLLDGRVRLERVESDVPAHHRATGSVRHDPAVRHGGGGRPQTAGEPRRIEHLRQFTDDVADRLSPDDELLILGPGTVRERLARELSRRDAHAGRHRDIACAAAEKPTDRQLVARLRRFAGIEPRRRTLGAYRWTGRPVRHARDRLELAPHRVTDKAPSERRLRAREE